MGDLEAELGPLPWWEVTQITQGTEVQRSQLHQDLTGPWVSPSPEEGGTWSCQPRGDRSRRTRCTGHPMGSDQASEGRQIIASTDAAEVK